MISDSSVRTFKFSPVSLGQKLSKLGYKETQGYLSVTPQGNTWISAHPPSPHIVVNPDIEFKTWLYTEDAKPIAGNGVGDSALPWLMYEVLLPVVGGDTRLISPLNVLVSFNLELGYGCINIMPHHKFDSLMRNTIAHNRDR